MNVLPNGVRLIRVALISGVALSVTACANEPIRGSHGFGPMMMLNGPAPHAAQLTEPVDPMVELSRKSLAAKVLTSRALETVTGLAIDPARLSEHD
ncbi:MAG: hypothetical protein ABL901_04200 [Hyphomicrobiaceae bacterium]